MSRDSDWEGTSLDETVRNLRVLSEAPGDLRFRQSIAASFEKVTDKLQRIEVRLTKIEERMVPRNEIARIAKTEMQVLESKVETLNRIVYGLCGAFGVTLIGIAVSRVFK